MCCARDGGRAWSGNDRETADSTVSSSPLLSSPRKAGIQYAAALPFCHQRLGILDRPLSQAMTIQPLA